MNHINENELVIKLCNGDVIAFNAIYNQYHAAVYLNILKLTKDKDTALDLLQEVFITLWQQKATINPDKSVSGWLFKVSQNKTLDFLRKTIRARQFNDDEKLPEPENPYHAEEYFVREKIMYDALRELSPQKRKVLELCKLQGKTYEETASELSISKHTVKEYLSAALISMKTYVKNKD